MGIKHTDNVDGKLHQCPLCYQLFQSTDAFSKHRVNSKPRSKCLTTVEMKKAGLTVNNLGFWEMKTDDGLQRPSSRLRSRKITGFR